MDTTPIASPTLIWPVAGMLHLGNSPSVSIAAALSFTPRDPYATTLTLHLHRQAVSWVFARVLLSRGLLTPTGDGDVRIWPDRDDEDHAVVIIDLCSRQVHALIELSIADALEFSARTTSSSPPATSGAISTSTLTWPPSTPPTPPNPARVAPDEAD